MTTTNGNRKVLDLKRWEFVSPAPIASAANTAFCMSKHVKPLALYLVGQNSAYMYHADEDAFVTLPAPGLASALAAGAAIIDVPWSTGATSAASLTATANTNTTTINTNQTLARDLRGFSVHIMSGANAGATIPIVSNTIGANAVITVAAQGTAFTISTTFRLLTPRWFVINGGASATGQFKFYDYATNTWNNAGNPPITVGTDSRLVSTPSWKYSGYEQFSTGTAAATGHTVSSLVTQKTFGVTNQWANYQVRIVSGIGAGQIRAISGSSTATGASTITPATNFTTAPGSDSVFSIEGNDDNIYYLGTGAVAIYKYSISAGTWAGPVTVTTARAGAPSTGLSGHWISLSGDTTWADETNTTNGIINGRRIYSLRGGASAALDYYDIALSTWASVTYPPGVETFTSGSSYASHDQYIYIQKEATGRWFRLNAVTLDMEPWSTMTYTQGAALLGDRAFIAAYIDGATRINYCYMLLNTSTVMLRQMVI